MNRDILVTGAGAAGLAASLALARSGLRTTCIDPAPQGPSAQDTGRSVALLPASVKFLRFLDVWNRIEGQAQRISEFRFAEAGGTARIRTLPRGRHRIGVSRMECPQRRSS